MWDTVQGTRPLSYVCDYAHEFREHIRDRLERPDGNGDTSKCEEEEDAPEWSAATGLGYRPIFLGLKRVCVSEAYEEWHSGGKYAASPFRGGMKDILVDHRSLYNAGLGRSERLKLEKVEDVVNIVNELSEVYGLGNVLEVADRAEWGNNIACVEHLGWFRRRLITELRESWKFEGNAEKYTKSPTLRAGSTEVPSCKDPTWMVASKVFVSTLYNEWYGVGDFVDRPVPGGLNAFFTRYPEAAEALSHEGKARYLSVRIIVDRIHKLFMETRANADTKRDLLDELDVAQRGRSIHDLAHAITTSEGFGDSFEDGSRK